MLLAKAKQQWVVYIGWPANFVLLLVDKAMGLI